MEDVTVQRSARSSEMIHSDMVLSAKEGKKKKKEKKRGGKNLNALANVDLLKQSMDGTCLVTDTRLVQRDVEFGDCDDTQKTSFENSSLSNDINISRRDSGLILDTKNTLEVNVNQVPEAYVNAVSMVVDHGTLISKPKALKMEQDLPHTGVEDFSMQTNSINSEVIHSDTVLSAKQGKKKKKKRERGGKNPDVLANVDLVQQPMDGTRLVSDSRLLQHDVEFGDCNDIQKTSFDNTSLSNVINISSRDSGSIVDTKNTLEVNVNQVPEARVNPLSMVVGHVDQVCTNNGSKEISLDAQLAKKKRKRKKGGKNLNVLTSNDVQYSSPNAPSIHYRSLENESIQQATCSTSSVVVSEVMLHGAELGLPVVGLKEMHQSACGSNRKIGCVEDRLVEFDLESTQEAERERKERIEERTKRKKRKGRKENKIFLTSNDELHDNLISLSVVSENPLYNDSIQQPVIDACLMMDSEAVQHDAKCDHIQKGIHCNSVESNDNNKGSRDIYAKMNAKSTPEANWNPFHKVAGYDDLGCPDDASGVMDMVPLQPKKTRRKKKKKNLNVSISNEIMPGTCIIADSELMQHNAEQGIPQEIHQNECATKDKNCNDKNSSDIIHTQNNSTVNVISVCQGKALGNMQGKKKRKRKIQGENLNLQPKDHVISSIDLSEEQQVKRSKLNADQNVGIGRILTGCDRKKLLVLDLNGLLADIVADKTGNFKADGSVAGKRIFKRPFCEDFLQFCFKRFTVGVWSSRKMKNVDMVIKVIMGGKNRSKLAFIWDQSHCTRTGFQTIENVEKPLFLKELSKLWNNKDRKLPWKVGDYDKSNTLLLDDSPYKALQNPPYTAIFPNPYQYQNRNDNGLGPGGDLRVYLEGLALAGDVQEYVEQNPFGQKPITKSDPCWSFYSEVISSRLNETMKFTPT